MTGDAAIGTDTLINIESVRGTNFVDTYVATGFTLRRLQRVRGPRRQRQRHRQRQTRLNFTSSTGAVTINHGVGHRERQRVRRHRQFTGVNAVRASNSGDTYNASGFVGFNEFEGLGGNDGITGNGATRISYSSAGGAVTVNNTQVIGDGSVGTDNFGILGVGQVRGSNFNDIFNISNANITLLEGQGGNDTFNGYIALSTVNGGDGLDTMNIVGTGFPGGGPVTMANDSQLVGIEVFQAAASSTGSINLNMSAQSEAMTITGTNFHLDFLAGGNANDTLNGLNGNDTLFGGGGVDTLNGGDGDDVLNGGAFGDVLNGGNGFDAASYNSAVTVNLTNTALNTGEALGDTYSSVEALYGSGSADTLIGDMNQNWLRGGAGGDVLDGGGGGFDWVLYNTLPGQPASAVTVDLLTPGLNTGEAAGDTYANFAFISIWGSDAVDVLRGNNGSNHLMGAGGADVLDGRLGSDFADYGSSTGLTASLANSALNTGDALGDTYISIENLWGGSGNDILTGDGNDNELAGQGGADQLDGGGGIDTVTYQLSSAGVSVNLSGGPNILGDAQGDTLLNFENLRGSEFGDFLIGTGTANVIEGLGGNDRFAGAGGADTYNGGAGNDTFVYAAPSDGGIDTIQDFVSGIDKLEINASGFGGGLVAGGGAPLFNNPDPALFDSGGGSGYFIFDTGGADQFSLYWDANGGSASDAVAVAVLQGVATLSSSDFQIV